MPSSDGYEKEELTDDEREKLLLEAKEHLTEARVVIKSLKEALEGM